jgi:hypothetical protein
MPGDKFLVYNAFSASGVDTTTVPVQQDRTDDGGTYGLGIQVGTVLVNTLLTFIFAISIFVVTVVGEANINTYESYDGLHRDLDEKCACTSFSPSLSYGLAASLFTEIGLMAAFVIFAVILTIVSDTEYSKPFTYYACVTGRFIVVNFFAFLCMTVAVMVLVAMGTSACCSSTSIAVASLSTFLLVAKVLFICCIMLTSD